MIKGLSMAVQNYPKRKTFMRLFISALVVVLISGSVIFFVFRVAPPNNSDEQFAPTDEVVEFKIFNDYRCVLGEDFWAFTNCGIISIYNEDGSKWSEVDWNETTANAKNDNALFNPFNFSANHEILIIRVVRKSANWFEVVVNEEQWLLKYIKSSSVALNIEELSAHVLNRSAISSLKHSLFDIPDGQDLGKIEHKHFELVPVEIRGNWLKVRVIKRESDVTQGENLEVSKHEFVWIKWRDGHRLLIGLYYFA